MSRRTRNGLVAGVLLCCAALGGCYTKIIDAKGLGSDRYDIHEPDAPGPNSLFGITDDF